MSIIFLFSYIFLLLSKKILSLNQESQLLTGKIISSDDISENTLNAFDNKIGTSFKSSYDKWWIGLDLLDEHYITKIGWAQNNEDKSNYLLGIFEGSNNETFYDAFPLYMIKEEGKINEMNYVDIYTTKPFRYIRYVGPINKSCIISEIEIYGYNNQTDILGFINNEENYYYQPTNIPLLVIHTDNPRDYTETTYEFDCNAYIINNNKIEASGKANRRFRGNISINFQKKSYRFKFLEEKKNFLNFPSKAKSWVLLANHGDKTLIRNLLALEISRLFEMKFTVNCKSIDFMCNGEYLGNYIICEKIEVKKDRINISKINESCINYPDITGGYILEVDSYAELEGSRIYSSKYNFITIKYPDEKDIVPEQHLYIESQFNEMLRKLFKNDLSKIDINSFAKYFLIQEYTANLDAYWSIRMYKDKNDDKFYFGPVWDFDLALDNDGRIYPINKKNQFIFEYEYTRGATAKFIEKILIDKNVIKTIKNLWKKTFENKLKDNYLIKYIDELVKNINESQRLNFIRWDILDKDIGIATHVVKYSYENETIFLKNFVGNRTEWMNKYILEDKLYNRYINNVSKFINNRSILIIILIVMILFK